MITRQDIDTDDSSDSDIDRLTGLSDVITLAEGDSNTVDSGWVAVPNPSTITGITWLDDDNDGQQLGGEDLVIGVIVRLYDDNGLVGEVPATNGEYEFTSLPPGEYTVEFIEPGALEFTFVDRGIDDTADSDADRDNGRTDPIVVDPGATIDNVDAGFLDGDFGSIDGTAWDDESNDGIRDADEPTLEGIIVTLFNSAGQPVATTTTGANGTYEFPNLPPDDYTLSLTPDPNDPAHAALLPTRKDAGDDDGVDSDIDRDMLTTEPITVVAGEPVSNVDAGFLDLANPSAITGVTWNDVNGNGQQDLDEALIPGTVVRLFDENGFIAEVTSTDGTYGFENLPAGDYEVEFVPPVDTVFTFSDVGDDASDSDVLRSTGRAPLTVNPGESVDNVDAGFLSGEFGTISGNAWLDESNNGQQSTEEPLLENIIVTIYNANGDPVATTTTDANGGYELGNLPPGEYTLGFEPNPNEPSHAALLPTRQDSGDDAADSDIDRTTSRTAAILVGGGEVVENIDAGFVDIAEPASISGSTWNDVNGNGQQDSGEDLLLETVVQLFDENGLVAEVAATDGTYTFENLPPGDYVVVFAIPEDHVFTFENVGDDTTDSDATRGTGQVEVTLGPGSDETVDAGTLTDATASIGDRLWLDANGNGVQDAGEEGVSGVQLRLFDADTDVQLASMATQQVPVNGQSLQATVGVQEGWYTFADLPFGSYYIEIDAVEGFVFTWDGNGDDTDADSNVDRVSRRTGVIDLAVGETPATVDFGIASPSKIEGALWDDTNSNGERDDAEVFPGITVTLFDAAGEEVAVTTTDESGYYAFCDIPEGEYFLGIDLTGLPADHSAVEDQDNPLDENGRSQIFSIGEDEVIEIDFGFGQPSIEGPPPALAFTGSEPMAIVMMAVLLLLAGLALVMFTNRRRREA